MNDLKLITTHPDYWLLVDTETYLCDKTIAYLPKHPDAPALEGVLQLPELPKQAEFSSLEVYLKNNPAPATYTGHIREWERKITEEWSDKYHTFLKQQRLTEQGKTSPAIDTFWLEKLCYYDRRNPDNNINTDEDWTEEELTKARKNCSCDNCFYGRTQMAERHIAELPTSEKSEAALEKEAAAFGEYWAANNGSYDDLEDKQEAEEFEEERQKYSFGYYNGYKAASQNNSQSFSPVLPPVDFKPEWELKTEYDPDQLKVVDDVLQGRWLYETKD